MGGHSHCIRHPPFREKDEPLYGLGCQESVRVLSPFTVTFLIYLDRTGAIEMMRIEVARRLRVRFFTFGYITPTGVTHSNPYQTVGPSWHEVG